MKYVISSKGLDPLLNCAYPSTAAEMPKKFAKEDIQNWTDKEVGSWLHSVSYHT